MRSFLCAILMIITLPVLAEKLTVERILSDPELTGRTPKRLEVSPDGLRVTFLRGKADDQNQLDLWEYHLKDNKTRLLVDSRVLQPKGEEISDAEKARRERARIASSRGIVDYQWSPDGKKLLFPLGGELYLYDLAAHKNKALRQLTHGEGFAIDPKISPKGHYVSFVREQNLWVIDLASGVQKRLTDDGKDTVHNGEAEFVAQEEMDRSTGYWWAPDDSAIAFERYDEAAVPVARRFEVYADRTDVVEQRYPYTGGPNVQVQLGLVSPQGGAARWIDLGENTDIYLTRVNWLPTGNRLSFQRMARNQQQLELVLVDAATLQQSIVLTETSKTWVDLNKDLHFLKNKNAFIWASERSGYKHLYLYNLDGNIIHPISQGDWNIDDVLAVNEKKGLVYIASNKDAVIDKQVYALKLDGRAPDAPQRISKADGWHKATFSDNAELYVDTFSDPKTPPQVSAHAADGKFLTWIEENKLDAQHPYWPYQEAHIAPEFGTLKADDGQTLYYRVLKPAGFDPTKRYPVFNNFYGGPHVQLVDRAWGRSFGQYMAQQGYVVFTLDNRGMARRGRTFSDVIFHQLGDAEVRDQLAGIEWLKAQSWVDAHRIGVFGWSYGGYMSAMMLAKASNQLAGGVSVAPVVDWALYDTFYTERYLGTPQNNAAGYEKSAVLTWLDGMSAPLLLAHGMADDNVLFTNSTKLMASLQQRGTQFELMTYPGGKHGLSTPEMSKHVYTAIARFFDNQIKNRSDDSP